MKKKLLYITTLTLALFFTACGGGDTTTNTKDNLMTTSNNRDLPMKLGESYTIEKGDSLVKVSSKPKIELETNTNTGKTTAKLLEGEAKIKHGRVIPSF